MMAGKPRRSTAAILLVTSIIVVIWIFWSLYLNPLQLPLFLIGFIVVIGFVMVMALLPKYRRRLVRYIYEFHTKGQEKGGWCYRYGDIALLIIILSALALTQYQLVSPQYSTVFVIASLALIAISFGILTIGFFRAVGKWVLLLIAVAVIIGILRALIQILMQT